MKWLIRIVLVIAVLLVTATVVFLMRRGGALKSEPGQPSAAEHLYVTWDSMEYDKCVSAWLIVRFIDANAQFTFVSQGTEVVKGIPFDIPGAEWSRKNRKCTSQCILESIKNPDPAISKIVSMAGEVELNFWQLDRWPDAQKCFYEVKAITDAAASPAECFEKTRPYFDQLYRDLKNKPESNTEAEKEKG